MSVNWSRRLALSFALALFSILIVWPASAVAAPQTSCAQDGPDDGAFVVELCLTVSSAPDASGEITVSASAANWSGPTNPRVQRMVFLLDGQPLLTDYSSTYEFALPTQKWADGPHVLEVEDMTRYIEPATGTNFVTDRVSMTLTFANGNAVPPVNTNTFTPKTGTAPPAGQPFLVMATGDGASGEPNADAVADMIASTSPNLFLYLGDVYENGTYTEFLNWYGSDSTRFGRFKGITNPTIGNHEYTNGEAAGYFDYWDNVPNYYSFDTQGWHFVTINSNSTFHQVEPGDTQFEWLKTDLTANAGKCTVAYMHHPRYSIGTQGDTDRLEDVWRLLAANGVDIVLGANDHNYQRWLPLDANGQPSPTGMTQFVVGSGGHGIRLFDQARLGDARVAVKYDTAPVALGALQLRLGPAGADFAYVNIAGETLDSGSIGCGAPPDTTPPVLTVPGSVTAAATSSAGATVSYSVTATDDRDPHPAVACVPPSGSAFPVGTTTVNCTATDASGNSSSASFPVNVGDTVAPVVTVPGSFSVNATSPAGAKVTYFASARDNLDPSPTLTCVPASGATVAIGTKTITCTARDAAGNSASKSFTVTVKGAAAQFVDLLNKTLAMLNLPPLRAAMKAHIESAASSLVHGNKQAACRALNFYIEAVRWQSGKRLTAAQANELIDDATRIKRVIGCA